LSYLFVLITSSNSLPLKTSRQFRCRRKVDSSLRRIQCFMSDYPPDTKLVACFVFSLLPYKLPYRLALDRTNWTFGPRTINILVLVIVNQGVAFHLLFRMMPIFVNSSTMDDRCIRNELITPLKGKTIYCKVPH
jgi:hypothetical protein